METTMSKRPRLRFLGSIAFKFTAILIAMGATTAASLAVAIMVFSTLADSVDTLIEVQLPTMQTSKDVIERSDRVRASLVSITNARDQEELFGRGEEFASELASLEARVVQLGPASRNQIEHAISGLKQNIGLMREAMVSQFAARRSMNDRFKNFMGLEEQTRRRLTEKSDNAQFDLTLAGEETITTVGETLASLTGRDFPMMQALLNARAEINLVAATSLAIMESRDQAVSAILADVVAAGMNRLERAATDLQSQVAMVESFRPVLEVVEDLRSMAGRRNGGTALQQRLIALRQKSDGILSGLIDDLSFELALRAEDTAQTNEAAIRKLLDTDAGAISAANAVETAVNALFVAALEGANANTSAELEGAQARMSETADQIDRLASTTGNDLTALLGEISSLASPESGLLRTRHEFLDAAALVRDRSRLAAATLAEVATLAGAESQEAARLMAAEGRDVLDQTQLAGGRLQLIGIVAIAIMLAAPTICWLYILRPMARVTAVTERLARGDLEPVTGLGRTSGEVGRMASALAVFRDGMVERQAMQAQEERRERDKLEAERAADAERRRLEHEARATAERHESEKRQRDHQDAMRQADMERANQLERDARAAEQVKVVDELALALQRLASGDLTAEITTQFPSGYDELRVNFNAAVQSISDLILILADNANSVNAAALDINNSATDLARRTERNAASLEESSAAIALLDASAKASAETASDTDRIMSDARGEAEGTRQSVESAVFIMSEVESSSHEISKIVDLIENIAFQTNLLALNAGVEAARAGEHGKGFAVVATEVRGLAQRSSEAAKDINTMITSTREQIVKGAVQVKEAGTALSGILAFFQEISSHIAAISSAAQEQAATTSEISSTIGTLDSAMQRNAAAFADSMAVSEQLRTRSEVLLGLAQRFRTTKTVARNPVDRESTLKGATANVAA
ncbi:MAG: HAMP domain-containing protein [Pseudooceanicola sp.]|nr:HAMP domain-containing protein [Pseudooceanicola sp.]